MRDGDDAVDVAGRAARPETLVRAGIAGQPPVRHETPPVVNAIQVKDALAHDVFLVARRSVGPAVAQVSRGPSGPDARHDLVLAVRARARVQSVKPSTRLDAGEPGHE